MFKKLLHKKNSLVLFLFILISFSIQKVFASVFNLETFDTLTDLTTKFYDDGSPVFTNVATGGIGNSGAIDVPSGSNDIWTTKQGYSVTGTGNKYTFSGFFELAANSGYGQVGFTSGTTNTGDFTGSPVKGLGFYFHGGGGGFVNNRTRSDVFWSPDLVYSPATWYWVKYEVTNIGSNKFSQHFEIWNTNGAGGTTTMKVQGNLGNTTNTDLATATTLHGYFSAAGSRIDKIDNFQVELHGGATFIAEGAPVIVGNSVSSVTSVNAVSGGNVTSDQGNSVTDYGVCYVAGTALPTLTDTCTSMGSGVGNFSGTFSGLSPVTTYTVRAYATNSSGTTYGAPQVFTTAYSLIRVGGTKFEVTETGSNTDSMNIVLTAVPATDVVLNISSGSTTAGTISPASLTFTTANWMNPQTITLTAVDNNLLDSPRLYDVTVSVDASSDPAYTSVAPLTIPATTLDDGDIFIEFSSATSSDNEATGGNMVKILINALLSSSVTVDIVNLLTGTAASGTDYTFTSPTTVTIPSGSYDGTLSTAVSISGLTVVDDSTYEGNETINFVLQNASGIKVGDANNDSTTNSQWVYNIANDDLSVGGGGGGSSNTPDIYVDAGMVGGANTETKNGTKLNDELVLKNVTDPESLTPDGHSNLSLITCRPSFPIRAKYNSKNDPGKIIELQKFLNTLVFRVGTSTATTTLDLPITGLFHRTDVEAVKKFEQENGLPVDGVWAGDEHDIASKIACGWVSPDETKEKQQELQDKLNKKSTSTLATTSVATTTLATSSIYKSIVCEFVFKKKLQINKPNNDINEVRRLQTFLNKELTDKSQPSIPNTGIFGPLTESAVKKFQAKYLQDIIKAQDGDTPTGIWGIFSIKKANQILCGK